MGHERVVKLDLDERTIGRRSADAEQERKLAIFELLEENYFAPQGMDAGPYNVRLGIEDGRLRMEITPEGGGETNVIHLPLTGFRRLIREYFAICDSYYSAVRSAAPAQIEAIDMGRRGVHNQGADLLRERLKDKVDMDVNTSRRLFTLLSILHLKV